MGQAQFNTMVLIARGVCPVGRRLMCNLVTAYASERDAHKRTEILRVIADILGASDADKQAVCAPTVRAVTCRALG